MTAILFPTSSSPGARGVESAGRLINAMAEALGAGAASKAKLIRAPGLREFCDTEQDGFRGYAEMNGIVYAAYQDRLVSVTANGVITDFGALNGDSPVFMAHNNKAPISDKVVVTEDGAFIINSETLTTANYPDTDLPAPTDVCFGDGFFFFAIANGRCVATGLNDTSVSALEFATAEGKSDGLMRCIFYSGQLYLCGPGSIEPWDGSTINPTGFPFNRVTVIQRGLIAKRAITGYENGFGLGLFFVGENGIVYALKGYEPNRISTPDVERDIATLADKSEIRMTSFVKAGHPCVVVKSNSWTWVLDLSTQTWHERKSYLAETWRGEQCLWAFDKWLCADNDSGLIGEVSEAEYREFGDALIWTVESAPGAAFPNRVAIPRADFQFAAGVGLIESSDPTETNPQVAISWSDDGETFGSPLMRSLGQGGSYKNPVTVTRTGQTGQKGRRWKLEVSDPVYVSLIGGDMQPIKRAA